MYRTAPALITEDVLVWARKTLGYNIPDAAEKIGVSPDHLKQWEDGALKPSVAQLKTIARVYKRPFACFYLPGRPSEMAPPRDFRRIHGPNEFRDAVALNLAIRSVEFRREAALELAALIEEGVPEFPHSLQDQTPPDKAASSIRLLEPSRPRRRSG